MSHAQFILRAPRLTPCGLMERGPYTFIRRPALIVTAAAVLLLFSSPMDRFRRGPRRTQLPVLAGSLLAATPLLLGAEPAAALEELELRLPLIGANLVVRLDELSSAGDLLAGGSDLAELDRASDGVIGPKVLRLFNHPIQLPPGVAKGLQGSVGSPLLREALLATTAAASHGVV